MPATCMDEAMGRWFHIEQHVEHDLSGLRARLDIRIRGSGEPINPDAIILVLFEPPRACIGIAAYAEPQGRSEGRNGKTQICKPDAYVAADGLDIV